MIYEIRHITAYGYPWLAARGRCVARLVPRDDSGQTRLDHAIDVTPHPTGRSSWRDFFGNVVVLIENNMPHDKLVIEARARVEVTRPSAIPADGDDRFIDPAWEAVREAALVFPSLDSGAPVHQLYPSPHVALVPEVTAYAAESFPAGGGIVAGLRDLMRRIRGDFDYSPESTDVATPLARAFAARQGVCQDFAHIMIAGLRGLGLPAGYVSGYIRTIPPPGKARLQGADATHAWVRAWCGPAHGWIGFDPTNAIEAGPDHIILAIGRDYSDVAPVDGVFLGGREHSLKVAVDVVPVG